MDYLQLISPTGGKTRTEEVTKISMGLHTMAQKHKITVVALSQLARADKSDKSKGNNVTPNMTALRESGQIEQDADVVMLLYREEPNMLRSRRILSLAKNKEGVTGRVTLLFNGEHQTFQEDYSGVARAKGEPEYKQVNFSELPREEPVPFEAPAGVPAPPS